MKRFMLIAVLSLGVLLIRHFENRSPSMAYAKASFHRGDVAFEHHQFQRAIRFYKKAISHHPQYSQAYVRLGKAYGKIGEYQKKIDSYLKAEEVGDAVHGLEYYELGLYYENNRQIDKAIEQYMKSTEIKYNHTYAMYRLALIYQARGDLYWEMVYYHDCARDVPQFPDSYFGLGVGYLKSGEIENAKKQVEKLRILKKNDMADHLARIIDQETSVGRTATLGLNYLSRL